MGLNCSKSKKKSFPGNIAAASFPLLTEKQQFGMGNEREVLSSSASSSSVMTSAASEG